MDMKRQNGLLLAGALALGIVGAAAAAVASGGGMGHHGCDPRHEGRFEEITQRLQDELALTEAQQPAFDAAVAAVEEARAARQARCEARDAEAAPATVLEMLDRAESHMSQGLAHIQAIEAAVGELYAVLDAEQRATLDRIVDEMRPRHG